MEQNNLTINNEVLAKMAGMAALEVEGVTGLAKFASDVKTIFSTGEFLRSVKVEEINGLINNFFRKQSYGCCRSSAGKG